MGLCYINVVYVVCLCSTSLAVIIASYSFMQEGFNIKHNVLKEISVYCDDLSLSPDEDEVTFSAGNSSFRQSVVGDRYICSTDNVLELVYKFVQRVSRRKLSQGQDTREHYLSCGNSSLSPKTGYLSATFSRVSNKTFRGQRKDGIVYWDTEHPSSYKWEQFLYNNGGVTVSEMRQYFIFVTAMFYLGIITETETQDTNTTRRVYVRVCVERFGHEEIVMQTSDQINGAYSKSATSLHIGSHVLLRKGDIVRVRVSDPGRIIQESKGNAFGLMPLA